MDYIEFSHILDLKSRADHQDIKGLQESGIEITVNFEQFPRTKTYK